MCSVSCQPSTKSRKLLGGPKVWQEVGSNHGLRLQKELQRNVVWMSNKVRVTWYPAWPSTWLCMAVADASALDTVSVPYAHKGDMEDAIAEEIPQNTKITSEIIINGQKTMKAKVLWHRMMYWTNCSSTDRLKCIQQIAYFNTIPSSGVDNKIISSNSTLGNPCLCIGNPIATLVWCEGQIFLTITQINQLHFASNNNLSEICLHHPADSSVKVDFHILHLLPATVDDNPTKEYDWCWSLQMEFMCDSVPGWFAHLINPSILVCMCGKPTYLLKSSFLVSLASTPIWGIVATEPSQDSSCATLLISLIDMRARPALFVRRMRHLIVLEISDMKSQIVQHVGQECRWTDQTDSAFWNTWVHISFSIALLVIIHRSCVVSASVHHQWVDSTWTRDMVQLQVTTLTSTVQLVSIWFDSIVLVLEGHCIAW